MISSLVLPDTWPAIVVIVFVMLRLMVRRRQALRVLVSCIRGRFELLNCIRHIETQIYTLISSIHRLVSHNSYLALTAYKA